MVAALEEKRRVGECASMILSDDRQRIAELRRTVRCAIPLCDVLFQSVDGVPVDLSSMVEHAREVTTIGRDLTDDEACIVGLGHGSDHVSASCASRQQSTQYE